MNNSKRLLAIAVSAALAAPMAAYATNGMNLDGYGPIAAGMGGASMAYDNGTAAMMNNPATIGMGDEGNRLDVAIGVLGPDVNAEGFGGAMKWSSESDMFLMPAVGWTKKSGDITYGAGGFAQGGMGARFSDGIANNMVLMGGAYAAAGGTITDATSQGQVSGWDEMSEVGVMRILFPVSKQINEQLNVGGSLDYVRAGMDLKMTMPGAMMSDMMFGTQAAGVIDGSMIDTVGAMFNPACNVGDMCDLYGGYFNFADTGPYTGEAVGAGFAAKIGFTFKANDKLTVGGTYHTKTAMGDLEGSATVEMAVQMNMGAGGQDMVLPIKGDISVNNFQWPATMALGVAFQANDKLMLVADVKQIQWADVMKEFSMTFKATDGGMFDGLVMNADMYQEWEDQTVIQLGGAYDLNGKTTLRAGYNTSSNPVPDDRMHYLFPAVSETAYTFGVGQKLDDSSSVDFAYNYVTENTGGDSAMLEASMSQSNWQLMYSKKF